MPRTTLRWLERGLFGLGAVLAVWCADRFVESRYVASLPVPPAVEASAHTLAGDAGDPSRVVSVRSTRRTVGSWVAKMDAPSVGLTATVLDGTDDATLGRGAGHIEHTPYPGEAGNVGIAGHRDTTFRAVRNLKLGDRIELTTSDRVYRYFISKTFIVNPEDVYVLDPADRPMLTLVTCYPFEFIGHAPRRYIIQAVLFDQSARATR